MKSTWLQERHTIIAQSTGKAAHPDRTSSAEERKGLSQKTQSGTRGRGKSLQMEDEDT